MRVIRAEQLTRAGANANAALEEHCTFTATCEIAGVTMQLCTDVPEVARLFALRYADHPAQSAPDFRYFVATVRGGYEFWCAHASTWRWTQGPLPADAIAFLADSVALAAIVRYDSALVSLQAACVEYNGIAAAIAGHSAAGKTATLFACARRGMHIYSDERTVLRNTIAHPYLRRTSVRGAGARLLLADQDADHTRNVLHAEPQTFSQDVLRKRCRRLAAAAAGTVRDQRIGILRRARSHRHGCCDARDHALVRRARRHGGSRDSRNFHTSGRAMLPAHAGKFRRNRCSHCLRNEPSLAASMMRTALAYAAGICCDCVLLLAAVPLTRYSLAAAHAQPTNRPLLLALLAANLLLLGVCLFGLSAWGYALFQNLRATHARVVRETAAMKRKSIVSRRTTPAN